jgi:hypothetical protein
MKALFIFMIAFGIINLIPSAIEFYHFVFTNHSIWGGNTVLTFIIGVAAIAFGIVGYSIRASL